MSGHLFVGKFLPLNGVAETLVSQNHLGAKSENVELDHFRPRPFLACNCDYARSVSPLLKVVETCLWAQNDRNMQVYISTYNKVKL